MNLPGRALQIKEALQSAGFRWSYDWERSASVTPAPLRPEFLVLLDEQRVHPFVRLCEKRRASRAAKIARAHV